MSLHHAEGPLCPLCESKILTAHPYLQSWFRRKKAKYPNMHCSWAFRDAESQEQAFADHKSNDHYPNSPHNHTEDGKPLSLALDIFQIDEDNEARFSPQFCALLDKENQDDREPILNGAKFKRSDGKPMGDSGHFQYQPAPIPPSAA